MSLNFWQSCKKIPLCTIESTWYDSHMPKSAVPKRSCCLCQTVISRKDRTGEFSNDFDESQLLRIYVSVMYLTKLFYISILYFILILVQWMPDHCIRLIAIDIRTYSDMKFNLFNKHFVPKRTSLDYMIGTK